jgi:hypothetical protein
MAGGRQQALTRRAAPLPGRPCLVTVQSPAAGASPGSGHGCAAGAHLVHILVGHSGGCAAARGRERRDHRLVNARAQPPPSARRRRGLLRRPRRLRGWRRPRKRRGPRGGGGSGGRGGDGERGGGGEEGGLFGAD